MGKRKRIGRSVKRNTNVNTEPGELTQAPHSFVIHKGLPGGHLSELTKDFRKVMEPFTATSLKERKKNAIKDFVSVAGLLHVSHMCIFSCTEVGMYLKICRLPRGPTLTFKVHNFSLSRDVVSSLKKQMVVEDSFKHSPLIVMNSFSGEGMQMKLMASMFQNMFPTINLTNVDLNTVRRCVLMNYNAATKLIDFRHYNIKVMPVGISKGVKKVIQGKVPNLAKCNDISEFLTKSGVLSESEYEDDPSAHVTLGQKLISRGNIEQGKSAVRLSELGPRLTLQLIKIEDGLLDGEVLFHDIVQKTEEEKVEIQKRRELKRKLKEKRKRVQDENKKKKDAEKQDLKDKSLKGMRRGQTETDKIMKTASREANKDVPAPEDDDAEYYRQEVGENPDKDLFSKPRPGSKRPHQTVFSHKATKKPRFENTKDNRTQRGSKTDKAFSRDNKKFGGKRKEKTNARNRDFRQIGGAAIKSGIKKFQPSRNKGGKFKRNKK